MFLKHINKPNFSIEEILFDLVSNAGKWPHVMFCHLSFVTDSLTGVLPQTVSV